jgi:hypothetical protein
MLTRFETATGLFLVLQGLVACGGGDEEDTAPAAAFSNKYLWEVGNCEVGALTPVDPETGETEICGGNARELDECVGSKLFEGVVRGDVATFTSERGTSERVRFERELDCDHEPSLEPDSCLRMAGLLEQYETLYVGRALDLDAEEQLHPDGLWMPKDSPWPGVAGCAEETP